VEVGVDRGILGDGYQEIANFVDEGVLPADDVPGRPPCLDVGMTRFGYEDGAEALGVRGVISRIER
jgi:hypothetical protein